MLVTVSQLISVAYLSTTLVLGKPQLGSLLVSPRVIRVVHKGMHLRVFHEVCCSTEVLLYSINTVRCSLVLR
jgi:hypothetical protein